MDYYKLTEKRTMTTVKFLKILDKHGTVVTIERAEKILELVYKLSNLSMKETLMQIPERHIKSNRKIFKRQTRKIKNENS